jgi:hypothetical protein
MSSSGSCAAPGSGKRKKRIRIRVAITPDNYIVDCQALLEAHPDYEGPRSEPPDASPTSDTEEQIGHKRKRGRQPKGSIAQRLGQLHARANRGSDEHGKIYLVFQGA